MKHLILQWLVCLKHYVRMCLFLSSPANLPYSQGCILLTLIAYIGAGELLLGSKRDLLSIALQIGIEVLLLSAISYTVLRLTHKLERLIQTVSALIGINLVVSIVSLPLLLLLPATDENTTVDPLLLQLNLALLLWNLAVISLIFKRSFEIRTLLAGFIAFNYFLLYEYLLISFF